MGPEEMCTTLVVELVGPAPTGGDHRVPSIPVTTFDGKVMQTSTATQECDVAVWFVHQGNGSTGCRNFLQVVSVSAAVSVHMQASVGHDCMHIKVFTSPLMFQTEVVSNYLKEGGRSNAAAAAALSIPSHFCESTSVIRLVARGLSVRVCQLPSREQFRMEADVYDGGSLLVSPDKPVVYDSVSVRCNGPTPSRVHFDTSLHGASLSKQTTVFADPDCVVSGQGLFTNGWMDTRRACTGAIVTLSSRDILLAPQATRRTCLVPALPADVDSKCTICQDAPPECTTATCGHLVVCRLCADALPRLGQRCPICRDWMPFVSVPAGVSNGSLWRIPTPV